MRSNSELKIPLINSELKGKHSLRYHGALLWKNISCEIRNLENQSAFTAKILEGRKLILASVCQPYEGDVGFI